MIRLVEPMLVAEHGFFDQADQDVVTDHGAEALNPLAPEHLPVIDAEPPDGTTVEATLDRAMISVATDRASFDVRAVGVAIADDHVLVTRGESGHVILPGGRVELMEHSRSGLVREMREELGVDVTVGRLLWLVENLFLGTGGPHHALEFYYAITLPPALGPAIGSFTHHEEIDGVLWPQTFHWLPVAAVMAMDLYPLFLRQALVSLPDTPGHIVNDERLVTGG